MSNKIYVESFKEPQDYEAFFVKQLNYQNKVLRGDALGYFLFLEHDDVYTVGRFAKLYINANSHLHVPIIKSTRGGSITYHGLGQLVFYPILNIGILKLKLKDFVDILQETVIEILSMFNLVGRKNIYGPGVWIKNKKVASIGISIRRGVSMHGISINLDCSIDKFYLIEPCGNPNTLVGNISDYKKIKKHEFIELLSKNFLNQLKLKTSYPKKNRISLLADCSESEP